MNNYIYVNELPDIIIHEIIEIYKNHELDFSNEEIQNALDSKIYDICEIIDIDEDWVKLTRVNHKQQRETKLVRIEDIQGIQL